MVLLSTLILAATAVLLPAAAHPGETHDAADLQRQIQARDIMAGHAKRSLDRCADNPKHRQLMARSVARRAETARTLRQKRGIAGNAQKFKRDLATLQAFEAVNHNMTGNHTYSIDTPESTIFSANTSCILSPEVTDGPYYVVGELIRQNVKESKYSDGVDLHLEVQYINVATCEPVPNVFVDIWNANASGVYSGISVAGNYAAGGWNSTFLRGIQESDSDGVVSFDTIFPGHYEGRATHTHLLAHMNVTRYSNNTISRDNNITHIGQLFYPESLRSAVEAVYPYSANTQEVVSNDDDMWSIVQAANDFDPFPEFVYLGDTVDDGLLAWIQIGINTTANYVDDQYYAVAAYYGSDGGEQNSGSSLGGGSGGMTGGMNGTMNGTTNGTAPSGFPPSSVASSSTALKKL